jgi:hypothetical protein
MREDKNILLTLAKHRSKLAWHIFASLAYSLCAELSNLLVFSTPVHAPIDKASQSNYTN